MTFRRKYVATNLNDEEYGVVETTANTENIPSSVNTTGIAVTFNNTGSTRYQFLFVYSSLYMRSKNASGWGSWIRFATQ